MVQVHVYRDVTQQGGRNRRHHRAVGHTLRNGGLYFPVGLGAVHITVPLFNDLRGAQLTVRQQVANVNQVIGHLFNRFSGRIDKRHVQVTFNRISRINPIHGHNDRFTVRVNRRVQQGQLHRHDRHGEEGVQDRSSALSVVIQLCVHAFARVHGRRYIALHTGRSPVR